MQIGFISANMTYNSNDDDLRRRMEAAKQAFRAQQKALNNIQSMLSQLMTDQNNEENFDNNEREEENRTAENKNTKESSSINIKIIKGIQTQIASLAKRDELKKVGMARPYLLEWDSVS